MDVGGLLREDGRLSVNGESPCKYGRAARGTLGTGGGCRRWWREAADTAPRPPGRAALAG